MAFPEEAPHPKWKPTSRWLKPVAAVEHGIGAGSRGGFFGIAWVVVRVWRGHRRGGRPGHAQGQRLGDGALRPRRTRLPEAAARGACSKPWLVLGFAAVAFALTLLVVPMLGADLIPQLAQDRFEMTVKLPPGTPLRDTDALVRELQRKHAKDDGISRAVRRQRQRHAPGCQPDRERREHRQAQRGDGRRRQRGQSRPPRPNACARR